MCVMAARKATYLPENIPEHMVGCNTFSNMYHIGQSLAIYQISDYGRGSYWSEPLALNNLVNNARAAKKHNEITYTARLIVSTG